MFNEGFELPNKTLSNLNFSDRNESHWVAWRKQVDLKMYFDSFGNAKLPIEIVKYFGVKNFQYNFSKY